MKPLPGDPIPLFKIGKACYISEAFDPPAVAAESPALSVLTDFGKIPPATIATSASITQANQAMIRRGVRSLLVTDDAEHLAGMISANDIHGDRLRQVAKTHGLDPQQVTVGLAMMNVNSLTAANVEDIESACVGDILATMRATGLQHLLVVEADAVGHPFLRGLFSTTQIARQMGTPTAALIDEPVALGHFSDQVIDSLVGNRVPEFVPVSRDGRHGATRAETDTDSSSELIAALESVAGGDWDSAHSKAQQAGGRYARLVHGYLHRVDGNTANARNWYEQGGEALPDNSLDEEWTRLMGLVSSGRT
jgi:hypothetical protein